MPAGCLKNFEAVDAKVAVPARRGCFAEVGEQHLPTGTISETTMVRPPRSGTAADKSDLPLPVGITAEHVLAVEDSVTISSRPDRKSEHVHA